MKLWNFQEIALQKLRRTIGVEQAKSILLVSPTGSGKTVMAAEIVNLAVAKGSRVLFLAPRSLSDLGRDIVHHGPDFQKKYAGGV